MINETHRRTIRFTLNGRPATADIATHETLVDVLRRDFGLFGGRESCGQGLCGCCTALVDGLAVSGCLYLAAFIDGTEVVTEVYRGTVSWMERSVDVAVYALGTRPLLGSGMLAGRRLTVEFVTNGELSVV